jgi:hypothetical protein
MSRSASGPSGRIQASQEEKYTYPVKSSSGANELLKLHQQAASQMETCSG